MTRKEIVRANIGACGYNVGQTIPGKGTEIWSRPSHVYSSWYINDPEEDQDRRNKGIDKLTEHIRKEGVDNVFAKEIRIIEEGGTKSFNFEDTHKGSLEKFPVEKMLNNRFEGILYISIYTIPKVLCVLPLSKVTTDLESQQDLVRSVIWETEHKKIYGDFLESSYDECDNTISFSASNNQNDTWEYNDDYTLFHGPSVCLDDREVECINGRLSHYNEAAVNDFWDFTMSDEDPFAWKDPESKVSVYSRKGKDWYVTSGMDQEEIYITYRDNNLELIEEEEFWYFVEIADAELVEEIAELVRGMVVEVEMKGLVNNELKWGNWSYQETYDYNKDIFNLELLKREYDEDLDDFRFTIMDYIDWSGVGDVEYKVTMAYEDYLLKNMDENNRLFGKYKHLSLLREIVENEGKELVYTEVGPGSTRKQWAIKYKGEEYHFLLSLLFNEAPKRFYKYISEQLTKRTTERIEMEAVLEKAKQVFVGLKDSTDGGNCMSGTKAFCARFAIDTNKIGGIRGDKLFELDYSPFTRRAVAQAIKKRSA